MITYDHSETKSIALLVDKPIYLETINSLNIHKFFGLLPKSILKSILEKLDLVSIG